TEDRMTRLGALLLFAACTSSGFGQNFPTRPIQLIVPYAAGGSADVVARPIAAEMGKLLGENVVVELRPGAGGNIGAEYVARSARADLTAVGGITTFPNVLLVSSQDAAGSLQDIIARARQNPGKVTYGSSGP